MIQTHDNGNPDCTTQRVVHEDGTTGPWLSVPITSTYALCDGGRQGRVSLVDLTDDERDEMREALRHTQFFLLPLP